MIFNEYLESSVIDPTIVGMPIDEGCGDNNDDDKDTSENEKKAVDEAFAIMCEALAPPRFGRDISAAKISENVETKLRAIDSPYAKEFSTVHSTVDNVEESDFGRLIRNVIGMVNKKMAMSKFGSRYNYMLSMQREVNDIYKQINKLFKNDNAAYSDYASRQVTTVTYNGIQLKDKISKNAMEYQPAPNKIPIVDILNGCVQYARAGRGDGEYAGLKRFKADVYDWLRKYYWYVFDCSPEASVGATIRMSMYEHLAALRNYINNIYECLYYLNDYMSQNSQYLLIIQKNHAEAARKVGDDKAAMKIIDEIYTEVLRYSQGMLDFDFASHELLYNFMQKYYEEVKSIYEDIKQKTGY